MPIFFHLQAHLWIAYLFFFNGLILSFYLVNKSTSFASLIRPFEALLLTAFFLSIGMNGLGLMMFDSLNLPFSTMRWGLLAITAMVLVFAFISGALNLARLKRLIEFSAMRLMLYLLVFLALFYNGGLIDQISDAWWHMSLANKISLASTLNPELAHLNGVSERYYPPLWHANLALAQTSSGISIPIFWNAFTAWGAVLKVMAFYLLAWSLSKDKLLAILAAALFFLLPGMGDSYMRVSAWPSHIAYTGLFCLFYIVFRILDKQTELASLNVVSLLRFCTSLKCELLVLFYLLLIVWFSHKLELLWFVLGMFAYYLCLLVLQTFSRRAPAFIEQNQYSLDIAGFVSLLACVLLSVWMLAGAVGTDNLIIDLVLSYGLLVAIFLGLLYCHGLRHFSGRVLPKRIAWLWLVLVMIALVLSFDLHHFISLFKPDMAYSASRVENYAVSVAGVFGHELALPGWHLQLRQAFLYSGLLSIPLSILLAMFRPSRLSLFTAGAATMVFLFCTSAYLYQWLVDATGYHSPWRIATLLFHPIIFAALLMQCGRCIREPSAAE